MPTSFIIHRLAKRDLREIVEYLTERNPDAADRFLRALRKDLTLLAQFPGAGVKRAAAHPRLANLRSWPVRSFRNYLIFYVPNDIGIEVTRILHGARDVGRLIDEV